jgi:hypothetical protein
MARFDPNSPLGGVGAFRQPPDPEDTTNLGPGVEGLLSLSRQARQFASEQLAENTGPVPMQITPGRPIENVQPGVQMGAQGAHALMNPLPEGAADLPLAAIPIAGVLKRSRRQLDTIGHRIRHGAPPSDELRVSFDNIMAKMTVEANKAHIDQMGDEEIRDFLQNYIRRGIYDDTGKLHIGKPGELHHDIESRLIRQGVISEDFPLPMLDDTAREDWRKLFRVFEDHMEAVQSNIHEYPYPKTGKVATGRDIRKTEEAISTMAPDIVADAFGEFNRSKLQGISELLHDHLDMPANEDEMLELVQTYLRDYSPAVNRHKFVLGPQQQIISWDLGQDVEVASEAIFEEIMQKRTGVSTPSGIRETINEVSNETRDIWGLNPRPGSPDVFAAPGAARPSNVVSLKGKEDPRAVEREIRTEASQPGGAATAAGKGDITAGDEIAELRAHSSRLVEEALTLHPTDPRRDQLLQQAMSTDNQVAELAKRNILRRQMDAAAEEAMQEPFSNFDMGGVAQARRQAMQEVLRERGYNAADSRRILKEELQREQARRAAMPDRIVPGTPVDDNTLSRLIEARDTGNRQLETNILQFIRQNYPEAPNVSLKTGNIDANDIARIRREYNLGE